MEIIQSLQNKKIKLLTSLQQRKYREKHECYVAEGYRLIKDLLPSGHCSALFIHEDKVEQEDIVALVEDAEKSGIDCYQIGDKESQKVANTEHSQGIWAIVQMEKYSFADGLKDIQHSEGFWIYLERVQDPGNLGTIIRTAVASGCKGIFLSEGSVDVYNPKTVRSTMSAISKIPIYRNCTKEETNRLLDIDGVSSYGITGTGTESYHQLAFPSKCICFFGNEGQGLDSYIEDEVEHKVYIPMKGNIESLNLSIAVALIAYKIADNNF